MSRLAKQISIVLIILAVVGIWVAYYMWSHRTLPSCFDSIKNQDEEYVDCGGICTNPCEVKYQKPPKILNSGFIPVGVDKYVLWVSISNENPNWGIGSVSYTFSVFGEGNKSLGEFNGDAYLLPNETKYILEEGIKITSLVTNISVSLGASEFSKFEDSQNPQLAISDKRINLLDGQVKISGFVTNESSFDFNSVKIIGVIKDIDTGKIVAIGATQMMTLLSGEKRLAEIFWPKNLNIDSSQQGLDLTAETNVFDQDNYYQKDLEPPAL